MDRSGETAAAQRLEGTVGLYWRTTHRYGAPHHPTVMTLHGGRLTAVTADDTVLLDAPVEEFAVRFTRWGTIILTRGEEVVRFVAGSYAGILAKPFTEEQRRRIVEAEGREPEEGVGFMAGALSNAGGRLVTNVASGLGAVAGFGARIAGITTMVVDQRTAFRYSRMWAELLHAAGAETTFSTKSYARSFWTAAAIALPILLVLIGGLAWLLLALTL